MPDAGNTFMGPPPTPTERVEYEIGELVKKQVEIGMDVISNGEPAGIGPGTMFELIDGFETVDVDIPADEPAVSLERVRWLGRDFFEAIAPIFRTVTDNGLILQIDDPAISHDWEEARRPPMTDAEYERFIMLRTEALNAALAGVPEDRVRFHTCWGSWPGMHTNEVPLARLVPTMLKVKAQAFSLESAKSTHRLEWQIWRDQFKWPEDKIIIPGVVDHTTPVVEPPEVVADTIINFANVCGRENVIAGTDCGMRWHAQAAWAKYENIVKGAELASERLWK
jgi:methionine synthase II (cobalamin-independent)